MQPRLILPIGYMPAEAVHCLELLKQQNYRAYLVGGAVRNILCHTLKPTDDLDIVTDAPKHIVEQIFKPRHVTSRDNLCRFTIGDDGKKRTCEVLSLEDFNLFEDARRRDFTINALYACNDVYGNMYIYDPSNRGLADICSRQQLNAIQPFKNTFETKPYDILRYIYFILKGFSGAYDKDCVRNNLKPLKNKLQSYNGIIPLELCVEKSEFSSGFNASIHKILLYGNAAASYSYLRDVGLFDLFFPAACEQSETGAAINFTWMLEKFKELDKMKGSFLKKSHHLYAILLASMIGPDKDIMQEAEKLLQLPQFPVNLRCLPWNTKGADITALVLSRRQMQAQKKKGTNIRTSSFGFFSAGFNFSVAIHGNRQHHRYSHNHDIHADVSIGLERNLQRTRIKPVVYLQSP